MEGANSSRKIKKVAGRSNNQNVDQHEEEKQSKPKRVTFEEEQPISVKQKKNENHKAKRQSEIEQYNTMTAEGQDEHNWEDDFDDEWGTFFPFITFSLTFFFRRRRSHPSW